MKCDGTQPICNQCVRFERARLCEFNTGPFPSINKTLEQRIARLELRISELERDDPNLVRLHDPYSDYRSSEETPTNCTSSRAVTASVKWWETVDPPERIRHELVQGFLVHAHKFGFFLDEERFQSAFNSPSISGSRPPSVLRNAVYVWGINLSCSPEYASKEHVFLERAIRGLHPALDSAQRQGGNILMVLQTEILLSQYFFHCNRLLEGRYHASAAMSLAILCDLHRGLPADIAQARLPPPADAVEEAERRRGWWAALTLDKTWVVALSPPSTLEPANDTEGSSVSGRRSGVHNCPLHPSSPHRLVKGPPSPITVKAELDRRPSPLVWLAEASLLYDQAHHLALSPPNNIEHETRLANLSNTIERFTAQLPQLGHIDKMSQGEAEAHNLVLSLCLCHCAMIQLHYSLVLRSPVFMARCLAAARAVVQMLGGVAQRIRVMNPIVGVLAMTAAEALLLGLQVVGVKVSSEYDQLVHSMEDLAAATQALSQYPFIAVRTQRLCEVASCY